MVFERKQYLEQLISAEDNGMIKIITGIRRCGKSFLLFNLYRQNSQRCLAAQPSEKCRRHEGAGKDSRLLDGQQHECAENFKHFQIDGQSEHWCQYCQPIS